jgi:uncharacterized membrane protein HdeD (DUF308 family)
MNPEAGQAWFRIAMIITVLSGAFVYFTEPDSAEHIISAITLIIGLSFIATIILLVRRKRS